MRSIRVCGWTPSSSCLRLLVLLLACNRIAQGLDLPRATAGLQGDDLESIHGLQHAKAQGAQVRGFEPLRQACGRAASAAATLDSLHLQGRRRIRGAGEQRVHRAWGPDVAYESGATVGMVLT